MSTPAGPEEKSQSTGKSAQVSDSSVNGKNSDMPNSSQLTAEQDENTSSPNDGGSTDNRDSDGRGGDLSPTQVGNTYPQAYPAHLTPQQPGYYLAYQSQVTPEPPSPAGPGAAVYDVGSFFQQPGAFHSSIPFPGGAQQFMNPSPQQPNAPPSPSQSNAGSIPPASPLFPRISGQATASLLDQHRMLDGSIQPRGAPLSPGPPYLSPALGPSVAGSAGMYQNMNAFASLSINGTPNSNSPVNFPGWGDNR